MNKKILNIIFLLTISILFKTTNVFAIERYFYLYDEIEKQAVLDNIKSTYVTSENGIDFAHTSSETNGRGVYIDNKSINEENKILYYRGNINNNFVIFKNFCWQILRTTSDGKIKLLYAGVSSDGKCLAENADLYAIPNKVKFNLADNEDNIGYMIPDEQGNINAKDSNVKSEVDTWFEANFGNDLDSFADTIFCNDRNYNSNAGHYNGWKRLQDGTPSLECERIEDSFSVGDIGNGKLTYPVALINTDELMYAGAQYNGIDSEHYYDSWTLVNAAYWAMTPNSTNKMLYPNSLGFINRNSLTASSGVRPLIAVNNDVLLLSGLGTREKPYNVYNNQKRYTVESEELTSADLEEAIETQPIEINHDNKDGYRFKKYIFINSDTNEEINLNIINENGKTYIRMPKHNLLIRSEWEAIIDNPNTTNNKILLIILLTISTILLTSPKIKKVINNYKQ